jgi:hypothetical protein
MALGMAGRAEHLTLGDLATTIVLGLSATHRHHGHVRDLLCRVTMMDLHDRECLSATVFTGTLSQVDDGASALPHGSGSCGRAPATGRLGDRLRLDHRLSGIDPVVESIVLGLTRNDALTQVGDGRERHTRDPPAPSLGAQSHGWKIGELRVIRQTVEARMGTKPGSKRWHLFARRSQKSSNMRLSGAANRVIPAQEGLRVRA